MRKTCWWARSAAYPATAVLCLAVTASFGSDPSPSQKRDAVAMKKSEIPVSVIKDIRRVRPGMTRADLNWLFTPDGGFYMVTPRSYIYRYAGADIAEVDAAGRPVLDKATHKPVEYAQAIKIDVRFRPAPGRAFTSADGRPDDVIVSVSDPYVGFANDN